MTEPTLKQFAAKVVEVLERGWTTGYFARDAEGNRTFSNGDEATCWCWSGALNRAWHELGQNLTSPNADNAYIILHGKLNDYTHKYHGVDYIEYNDNYGSKERVIAITKICGGLQS